MRFLGFSCLGLVLVGGFRSLLVLGVCFSDLHFVTQFTLSYYFDYTLVLICCFGLAWWPFWGLVYLLLLCVD